MNFNMTRPCAHCPFRKDIKGCLTKGRVKEIVSGITRGDGTFQCHETLELPRDKQEHCAGAMIFLEKQDKPNQMMRIAERLRLYDRTKLDMESQVFNSYAEMRAAQRG